MKKYIKDTNGKFAGSIPRPPIFTSLDKEKLIKKPNKEGTTMENNGISKLGDSAEDFYRATTNSIKPTEARLGDALVDGKYYVEIKTASSNTLNQVRAVKYIPLIVYDKRDRAWYVVPPNVIISLVSNRARGQHTENPFESVTVSISQIKAYKVDQADLLSKTLSAVLEGAKHNKLKQIMDNILVESRKLAEASKNMANNYFKELENKIK